MKSYKIKAHLLNKEVADLKAKNKSLEQHVERLSESIHRHTSAKQHRKPIKPGKALKRQTGDKVRMVIGDSHGSSIDATAAAAFLCDLERIQPDEIIMLGDHVNCGGFLAEHHVMGYVAETEYSYADDIAFANAFLDSIQKAAPKAKIWYLEGNHESRVEKWVITETLRHSKDAEFLRRALAPEFLLHLADRGITYIRRDRMYDGLPVQGAIRLGKCYFYHGVICPKHACAANLQKVGGNICFGHTHRRDAAFVSFMAAGDVGSWNPGCLCLKQPMWRHGDHTGWTQGELIQLVRPDETFLSINIPIIDGVSLLNPLMAQIG